jgi:ABC-type proline/glycine betaine transport system permease subunit
VNAETLIDWMRLSMFFAFDLTTLTGTGSHTPYAFYAVLALGLLVAVPLGLVAFYNSKRPAGLEGTERPKYVPKIEPKDE